MDKSGPVKEIKYQGNIRPIKLSELDDEWLISDEQLTRFYKI